MAGGYGSNKFLSATVERSTIMKWIKNKIYPPMPTLNIIPKQKLDLIQKDIFRPGGIILNIGAGEYYGSGKRLWASDLQGACKIISMDISPGKKINVVADAHEIPFGTEKIDSIVLQAVIEHVQDPQKVISEAFRVLKPGGYLYLEVPFLQGVHADPYDFQRYTIFGLQELTKNFDLKEAGVSVGPFCTLVWVLRDGISSIFDNRLLYFSTRFIAAWSLAPLRYLDYLIRNTRSAERLASEYYLLAKKPHLRE